MWLQKKTPYWDQLQHLFSSLESLDWQTTPIHLALSYKQGQLAQFYPNKQAHSICYRIRLPKSISWVKSPSPDLLEDSEA